MLSPNSRGWIKKYFSLLQNYTEHLNEYPGTMSAEELIYGYLQPTGIMYGYPAQLLFLEIEDVADLSNQERFKVLLLEGLILVDHIQKGSFEMEALESSLEEFVRFYEETQIEQAKKSWLNFKGLTVDEKLESIISQRVDIKMSLSHKLWTSYLYNSLLFQDIILYHQYCYRKNNVDLKEKRSSIMLDMIKVVATAAHADGEIQDEEKAIFDIFMASADLTYEQNVIAREYWEREYSIESISFEFVDTWLLKRYMLEVAILTVWSDRVVVDSEQEYLDRLSERLGIDPEEKDRSFIAIQSFVIQNSERIPFLSGKNEAEQLLSGVRERWKKILSRNKDKLAQELSQSKELVALIAKSTSNELSKEEKKKVKAQFKDLAKTIPALTLFMLPGGSVILPVVLKLIPDLVPSAFRNNVIEEASESESTQKPKE